MNITKSIQRAILLVCGLAAIILAVDHAPGGGVDDVWAEKGNSPVAGPTPDLSIEPCLDYGSYDDADDDGWNECFETVYGSDPNNGLSTAEHLLFDALFEVNSCGDGVDNDLDGRIDEDDGACLIPAECLGPLRSALVRSGLVYSVRDPETGDPVFFGHFNKEFNPGDYRGTSDWALFVKLFGGLFGRTGCVLPVPRVAIFNCIDFSDEDPCPPGDTDNDGFQDISEVRLGSDPNDANSTPEFALLDEQTGSVTCGDGTDNDLDGRKDRGDSGCTLTCADYGTKERCLDEDHDGWLKYVELWYGSDPNNPSSYPGANCIDYAS